MARIQDVDLPYLEFAEAAAPSTPASGIVRIYAKSDGSLYQKDDAGTETGLAAGATVADHNHTAGAGDGGDLDAAIIDGFLIFNEEAAPSTPASGTVAVYAKSDGKLYIKDDAGTETDLTATGGGGSNAPLGITAYAPGSDTSIASTSSATQGDADATNLTVTFTAPASGNVIVTLEALCNPGNGGVNAYWGLRESSSDVAGPQYLSEGDNRARRYHMSFYLTGVSGGSHTYKWAFSTNGGATQNVYGGPLFGKAILTVWAA